MRANELEDQRHQLDTDLIPQAQSMTRALRWRRAELVGELNTIYPIE